MKKKNALVILLTVLVFLSGAVLGFSSVYRVDEVMVEASTISLQAELEAEELQKRLTEAYNKQFTPFANDEEAQAIVADFPYFRVTSVEKAYPNRLIVRVREDDEVYAISCGEETGKYYILNREGTVLGIREDYVNRSDKTGKGKNVLVKGVNVQGEKGKKVTGDATFSYLFDFCAKADETLQGIRRNIITIEKIREGSSADTEMLRLTTYEGVKIYVNMPSEDAQLKAQKAVEAYMSLSDAQRTRGMVAVAEVAGEIKAVYSDKDVFENVGV